MKPFIFICLCFVLAWLGNPNENSIWNAGSTEYPLCEALTIHAN